jgi:RNA polymerase sigma-70 factor (ECF subfamily)
VEICSDSGESAAWSELVARTQGLVAATIAATIRRWRACKSAAVDDVVQEVYLKISANHSALLRNFAPRHPNAVLGYLRAVSSSVAQDYCKRLNAAKRGSGGDESLSELDPPSSGRQAGGAASMERAILITEIDCVLRRMTEGPDARRDQAIFWLYYRQGFTASSIASIRGFGLTVKGVESTILRLTRLVRHGIGVGRVCAGAPTLVPKGTTAERSL